MLTDEEHRRLVLKEKTTLQVGPRIYPLVKTNTRKKFEYQEKSIPSLSYVEELNSMGKLGWIVVHSEKGYEQYNVLFCREVL